MRYVLLASISCLFFAVAVNANAANLTDAVNQARYHDDHGRPVPPPPHHVDRRPAPPPPSRPYVDRRPAPPHSHHMDRRPAPPPPNRHDVDRYPAPPPPPRR